MEDAAVNYSPFDKAKLWLATGMAAATFYAGFYHFETESFAMRTAVLVLGMLAAMAVGYFSAPGRQFVQFSREAVEETRKVVWPSRGETLRVTGLVLAFVTLVAIFLWIVDAILTWAFQAITF
jgi:preprotein translocase subunit SecE